MPPCVAFLERGAARSDLGRKLFDLAVADRLGVLGGVAVSILTGTHSLSRVGEVPICC